MSTMNDPLLMDTPLSSASARYRVRQPVASDRPGPPATRPLGLRHAQPVPTPANRTIHYCHQRQVAVDEHGQPLIETMGKDWRSKDTTDGDEGPEESVWEWEER